MGDLRSRAADAQQILKAMDDTATRAEQIGQPVAYEQAPAPLPSVAESGIAADLDVPVHVAWSRVMGEVQWVAKADRTTSGTTYNYRGVDRVVDSVAPFLRKHGVIVMPVKVRPEYTVIQTKSGSAMNYCRVTATFAIIGPRGDVLSAPNDAGIMVPLLGEAIGEGFDTGDKSSMKAQSVALREFYVKALAIPVSRPQADPEHGEQHEIVARGPSAAEYAAMIQDPDVSLARLQQIKAELIDNRAIGATVVTLFDNTEIRLIDLVQRIGKAKMATEGGR